MIGGLNNSRDIGWFEENEYDEDKEVDEGDTMENDVS